MSEKQETTADIIAEMRDEAARADMEQDYSIDDAAEMMREFAWRLEAAHRRELSKNVSKNGADFGQLGDAAKLREVLEEVLDDYQDDCAISRMIRAALAAPPRNCDVPKVVEDPWRAWIDDESNWEDGNPKLEIHDWLLAPATEEEGGAK